MLSVIFAAALAGSTPSAVKPQTPVPPPVALSAAAKVDQKLGCAVLFVGFDEIIRGNPELISKFDEGDGSAKALPPLLKMLGASGETVLNDTLTEAIGKGQKPADVYRRGLASLSIMVTQAPVTKTGDKANEERGIAVFTQCLSLMTE